MTLNFSRPFFAGAHGPLDWLLDLQCHTVLPAPHRFYRLTIVHFAALGSAGAFQRQQLAAAKASSPSIHQSLEDEPTVEGRKRRRPGPHPIQRRSRSRSSSCSSRSGSGSSSGSESDSSDCSVSGGASSSSSSTASLQEPRGTGKHRRKEATTAPAKSLTVFGPEGVSGSGQSVFRSSIVFHCAQSKAMFGAAFISFIPC